MTIRTKNKTSGSILLQKEMMEFLFNEMSKNVFRKVEFYTTNSSNATQSLHEFYIDTKYLCT